MALLGTSCSLNPGSSDLGAGLRLSGNCKLHFGRFTWRTIEPTDIGAAEIGNAV
jgi:hypothetical protein